MENIPILNIKHFEQEESLNNFYFNLFSRHLEENQTHFHKPHKHDFYLCVFFTKGDGIHEVDFQKYPIEPYSVFFLKPGQTHFWDFKNPPKGYIFFHTKEFFNQNFTNEKLEHFPFYYSYKNPPNLVLTEKTGTVINSRFEELQEEYSGNLAFKNQKILGLINLLYVDLSRQYTSLKIDFSIPSPTYLQILQNLEKTIEEFFKVEKSATFYAEELNISPKHLNRISKATINKTTTELITERIILEAKRLLVHSDNPLSKIAFHLGYEDYSYFSKVFKQKTGNTPLEFRKAYN